MKFENKKNISKHIDEYDFQKLKLKFLDKNEIKIFSTLCQDGIFSIDEIIYNKRDKLLIRELPLWAGIVSLYSQKAVVDLIRWIHSKFRI